jgi:hypothetical protein
MTIISGTSPSIECYTRLNYTETQRNSESTTKITRFSTIYSEIQCTNKIGTYLEELENIVDPSSDVIIENFSGTFLFDTFGNINCQSCKIKNPEQTEYIDEIVFGTGDFLNSSGFKFTIYNLYPDIFPNINIHYIWIEKVHL